MTTDTAFAAYEAVRHRLPTALVGGSFQRIKTLEEVADLFDVFFLDAFGVLNIGETAIPGTADRVRKLRAKGKRVLIVSNAASVPGAVLQAKYRRLGFDFDLQDIVTSRTTMQACAPDALNMTWGVMATADARLEALLPLQTVLLADDPQTYRDADGFVLLGSGSWTPAQQQILEAELARAPRRVLVANPDIVAPREQGFSTEPGFYAHQLADRTGVTPEFFGKPFANIYEQALKHVGPVELNKVLMVGDSLHTDVLGAHAAGIASALVSDYGFFAGHDVDAAIASSGIVPTFVTARP